MIAVSDKNHFGIFDRDSRFKKPIHSWSGGISHTSWLANIINQSQTEISLNMRECCKQKSLFTNCKVEYN